MPGRGRWPETLLSLVLAGWWIGSSAPISLASASDLRNPGWVPWACELPVDSDRIGLSHHVWLTAAHQAAGAEMLLQGAQAQLDASDLYLGLTAFDQNNIPLPIKSTVVNNTEHVARINQAAAQMLVNAYTWDDLVQFIDAANAAQPRYFLDKSINIYLLEPELSASFSQFKGFHVRDVKGGSGDLIFMPADGAMDTLVHELGHAFSLEHVNFHAVPEPDGDEAGKRREYCVEYGHWDGECDFERSNFMWAAAIERSTLTLGQRLRAVCNESSALNRHGDRPHTAFRFVCPDWSRADLGRPAGDPPGACPVLADPIYVEPPS
jgi:hypothetical protein